MKKTLMILFTIATGILVNSCSKPDAGNTDPACKIADLEVKGGSGIVEYTNGLPSKFNMIGPQRYINGKGYDELFYNTGKQLTHSYMYDTLGNLIGIDSVIYVGDRMQKKYSYTILNGVRTVVNEKSFYYNAGDHIIFVTDSFLLKEKLEYDFLYISNDSVPDKVITRYFLHGDLHYTDTNSLTYTTIPVPSVLDGKNIFSVLYSFHYLNYPDLLFTIHHNLIATNYIQRVYAPPILFPDQNSTVVYNNVFDPNNNLTQIFYTINTGGSGKILEINYTCP